MKIGIKLNQLTYSEYIYTIKNHKKYTDFNTLALYRSIIENDKLDLNQKIEIRELAHQKFKKSFDFLQIKDPEIYFAVSVLGDTLTRADALQLWKNIYENQEKILKAKRIKHRNFGTYSKHLCGMKEYGCPYDGMMLHQNNSHHCTLGDSGITFDSDKRSRNRLSADYDKLNQRANRRAVEKRTFRDNKKKIINELINSPIDLN